MRGKTIIHIYLLSKVRVHPSMAMSLVAAKAFTQKNTYVNVVICVSLPIIQLFMFDPMNIRDSPAYKIRVF